MTKEEVREIRGELTQKKFAEALGVSLITVKTWEAGRYKPSGLYLKALERYRDREIEE